MEGFFNEKRTGIYQLCKHSEPREIICLEVVPVNTRQDGTVFLFIAADVFSKFAFNLGAHRDNDDTTFLNCIKLLLKDTDFKRHQGPYTLILSGYEHIEDQICKKNTLETVTVARV